MAGFCTSCGAPIASGGGFCPKCGKPVGQSAVSGTAAAPAAAPTAAPAPTAPPAAGLADNVAGMLAYITIIPAILFLVMEPYNRRPFIRFHAFQCLFTAAAWFAVSIVLGIIASMPVIGLIMFVVWPLFGLAGLALWIVLVLKAFQGQMFKLPVIGDLAEKQANAR